MSWKNGRHTAKATARTGWERGSPDGGPRFIFFDHFTQASRSGHDVLMNTIDRGKVRYRWIREGLWVRVVLDYTVP